MSARSAVVTASSTRTVGVHEDFRMAVAQRSQRLVMYRAAPHAALYSLFVEYPEASLGQAVAFTLSWNDAEAYAW